MLVKILIAASVSAAVALVMGVHLRWLHRRYVTPLDFPNKELASEVEQTRVVHIDCPPDKALLAARNALLAVPKIKDVATTGRSIKAKTRVTFRTFGENIAITAVPSGTDSAELTIQSKPRFSGTTIDYGKSYENVERIVSDLARGQTVRQLSANNSFKPTPLRGAA
jgi:hypothetical protein